MKRPQPGERCTVGVIDCRVLHIAGEETSLCGRWSLHHLWSINDKTARRVLPLCKRCKARTDPEES